MKSYDNIFFDFDGTIMDTSRGIFNSFDYALKHFNRELPGHDFYFKLIGPPLLYSFEHELGFDHETALSAVKKYREFYREKGIYQVRLYPGIKQMLEALFNAGKKIYLATSKPQVFARELLQKYSLDRFFAFIGGSDGDNNRTSKSEVIAYVMNEAKIESPKSCVLIGDRRFDAEGAASAGMDCIGITWGFGSQQELLSAGAAETFAAPQSLTIRLIN